jgi:hypothetical protein
MILLLHLENCRRDRKYGEPETGKAIHMTGSADKDVNFRYAL